MHKSMPATFFMPNAASHGGAAFFDGKIKKNSVEAGTKPGRAVLKRVKAEENQSKPAHRSQL
jgi:hypothetical protein